MRITVTATAICLSIVGLSIADDVRASIKQSTNIPAQPLAPALQRLAKDRNFQIVYISEEIGDRRTAGAVGEYTPEEALKQLLKGTGLTYKYLDDNTITIVPPTAAPAAQTARQAQGEAGEATAQPAVESKPQEARSSSFWERFRLAQASRGGIAQSSAVEQGGAQQTPQKGPVELQEIIVTAQKREERASNVPQSITAVSGDALRADNVQSLADLSAAVPGLTITSPGGVGQNQIILRGITSGNDLSPSVSVYVDDVPYGGVTARSQQTGTAFETGSFDLSRVEVLRGPQGTLYGAAAFGGIVKYAMTPPSLSGFSSTIQLDGSGTDGGGFNNGVRAAVNLPLVADVFAARASFIRNHDAGYIRNVFNGETGVNRSTTTAARLSLLGKPTEWLTLRATVLGQDIHRNGTGEVDFTPSPTDPTSVSPTHGDLAQSTMAGQGFVQKFRLYSLGADADVGFGQASTTVAYQTVRIDQSLEGPLFVGVLGPILASMGYPIDDTAVTPTPASNITTVETRLQSNPGASLEWLGGMFYTREQNTFSNYLVGYLNGATVPFNIFTYHSPTVYKEYAGFGDLTYHFTQAFDAGVGLRISHNQQDISQVYSGIIGGPSAADIRSDESVKTYLATLRYHLSETSMLYARAASGYRPGGPNVQVTDPTTGQVQGAATFKSDSLWNYEVGMKLSPLPNLTVDLSAFHILWKDIQLITVVNGFSAFVNGGRAKSDGLETSVAYQPIAGLTVGASGAYAHARLADDVPGIGGAAGDRLPIAPRISAALRADYRTNVGGGWQAFGGGNLSYVGSRTTGFDSPGAPQYVLPSYETVNLRAGAARGGWELMVYAKNVFNKLGQNQADTSSALPLYRISIIEPRSVGAQVTFDF